MRVGGQLVAQEEKYFRMNKEWLEVVIFMDIPHTHCKLCISCLGDL